ncbi:hypothetical protein A0256_11680 [Mucilaginibacter sp. PAMC 26640]|nr:hypothetical protein A0256_11680 [Mucilaginibacter sp. PAMC 26640]
MIKITLAIFLFIASSYVIVDGQTLPHNNAFTFKGKVKNLVDHQRYIEQAGIDNPCLIEEYCRLMKRNPKLFIIPFAIGEALQKINDPRCIYFLQTATELKADYADAWVALSHYNAYNSDAEATIKYLKRAVDVAPKNSNFRYELAIQFKDIDPGKSDSLMLDMVHRFPNEENAIKGLFQLTFYPYNQNEKGAYFEQIYSLGLKDQSNWFWGGMKYYFDYLINKDENKAFELALKMVLNVKKNRTQWKAKLQVARSFIEAGNLLNQSNSAEALNVLDNINLGNSPTAGEEIDAEEKLVLRKADAIAKGGNLQYALNTLMGYYIKTPTDSVYKGVLLYAKELNLDNDNILNQINKIRNENSLKLTNFSLEDLTTHKSVSLSDYQGKVILLTFWFPSCEPCLQEFKYFEKIIKQTANENLVYLAVNSGNVQEKRVLPLIKAKGYTFVPLRDTPNKSIGNLPLVQSLPANFLIDKEGRVVFNDFQIGESNQQTLELMIASLLSQ